MEQALRYELEQNIPELKGELYPTNAPETSTHPYLVYYRSATDRIKTLEGYGDKQALTFMFSIMAARYADMKALRDKVEHMVINLPGRDIGENGDIYVEDIELEDVNETYEFNLKLNRGIIVFTVFF